MGSRSRLEPLRMILQIVIQRQGVSFSSQPLVILDRRTWRDREIKRGKRGELFKQMWCWPHSQRYRNSTANRENDWYSVSWRAICSRNAGRNEGYPRVSPRAFPHSLVQALRSMTHILTVATWAGLPLHSSGETTPAARAFAG
jgi:hypothetical protein